MNIVNKMNIVNLLINKNLGSIIFNYLSSSKEEVKKINKSTFYIVNILYTYFKYFDMPNYYKPSSIKDKQYVNRVIDYVNYVNLNIKKLIKI